MPVISSGGLWTAVTGGGELIVSGQDVVKITHSGGLTSLQGADATGDDLTLKANQTDTFPSIKLLGNQGMIWYLTANETIKVYGGGTEAFRFETQNPNLAILETGSSPTNISNCGQLYTKSTNKLFFMDGDGAEHEIQFV